MGANNWRSFMLIGRVVEVAGAVVGCVDLSGEVGEILGGFLGGVVGWFF